METQIASIWQELLGIDKVGVYDNFFELGGHSLLATQVISRIRTVLNLKLTIKNFFESPTICGICAKLQNQLEHSNKIEQILNEIDHMFST
jgi:acyl carrier protein